MWKQKRGAWRSSEPTLIWGTGIQDAPASVGPAGLPPATCRAWAEVARLGGRASTTHPRGPVAKTRAFLLAIGTFLTCFIQ